MRIAYVEDEKIQSEVMLDYFKEYQEITRKNLQVDVYASADELIFKNDGQYPFDLMLLDIQMKGTSGMELAHQIRQTDQQVTIVFLTAVMEYVFEGYEVNAYRYLLKPIQKEKLFNLLDELADKMEKHYCLVYIDKTQIKIAMEDIMYLQSDGHYVHLITDEKDYMVKENFSSFIQQFLSFDFIQTHRSYVVNMAFIARLDKENCILDNGDLIPVSRQQKKVVMEAFMNYFKGSFKDD